MPRHRPLTLKKFIDSIPEPLLKEYFKRKLKKNPLPFTSFDHATIEKFLKSLDEKEASSIHEDFNHVNDICERNMNHLIEAVNRYGVETTGEEKREALAMDIFLNHEDAFEYAYDRYCLYSSSSKMSHYKISADGFEITDGKLKKFKQRVSEFYSKMAKGQECDIRCHEEEGQTIIVVTRGSYKRSVPAWRDRKVETLFFRPASEDYLQFNNDTSVLSIKAPYEKDKENYIKTFAEEILEDPNQADREDKDNSYTLAPLQDGTFSFNGNERITSITILEVKLALRGSTNPAVIIKSHDVLRSLSSDLSGVTLQSGELVHAKFRFKLDVEGKQRRVTFEITPPNVTDLIRKRYADVIGDYLKENGVKLV